MFLRSLTLKGFKSFAESTTLDLEPGLTVVVGPNGSGKSNVVDAVAWVLGAQGPRTLRSAKMDDVIFAGTGRRAALGRAEVSLTIDNSRGSLPIDLREVTISRTLFRTSGESEYTINGVPCRLLDLQELLSDSGVGRQQHVIVSQGHLDSVLDARPEDRRLVVEEAAGILKYRRRKEKAERRLEGTEANLVRLTDLLHEVRRQIRPLERQADAARRHGTISAELNALQKHLRGRELAVLTARHESAVLAHGALRDDEASVAGELDSLDSSVSAGEERVASLGRDHTPDAVGRLEALRERGRGLEALVAERGRSLDRDLAVSVDSALIVALEEDAGRIREELVELDERAAAMSSKFDELAGLERKLVVERESIVEPALEVDRAAAARGELSAISSSMERARADLARRESRLADIDRSAKTLEADGGRVGDELAAVEARCRELAEASQLAHRNVAEAERASESAQTDARRADLAHGACVARVEALELAVDGSGRGKRAAHFEGLPGLIGPLVEMVTVEHGYEAAFEAGAEDVLGAVVADAVVVEDIEAGRKLLSEIDRLSARAGRSGSDGLASRAPMGVLPLGPRPEAPSVPGRAPGGTHWLSSLVRSHHRGVEGLLRHLLASTVVVDGGWEDAVAVTVEHPGLVAVTRDGDRFSSVGWHLGVGAPAAMLAALDEASETVHDLARTKQEAQRRVSAAAEALAGALAAARSSDAEASAGDARYRNLEAKAKAASEELSRVQADSEDLRRERDRLRGEIDEQVARADALELLIPSDDAGEADPEERADEVRQAREQVQRRGEELAARRAELDVRSAGLGDARDSLATRLVQVETRLEGVAARREDADLRRESMLGTRAALGRLGSYLSARMTEVEGALADARQRREAHVRTLAEEGEALEAFRRRRQATERRLAELRERAGRLELETAEARLRLETAEEALRRELECEPSVAMATICPEVPEGASPAARVRELERELRLMGPVNPLALEELKALQERSAFLTEQLDDVKSSRRELVKVIHAVEAEMSELLSAALADVVEHFAELFETLFPGGQGRLQVTNPENILDSGIELDVKPAGKNVRRLSLLSGGERSLCALAFLFAVFRSRPSPFYLLDEVEAALDDVNLSRFVGLLRNFREEAQLVVVTHQKRTMEAADCLYGVSLQPGGSSKVVSERLRERV